jgi:outer membrane lipoprotein-sorting protein
MNRSVVVICAVLLLGASPLSAQTPSVDELLAKNAAARGGADKLKSVSTRKVEGTVAVQGMEMPMLVLAKRPNLMLQEMQMQGRRVVTAFDGEQAWAINPMFGDVPQKLQGVQADLIRDQAQFDGPLAYARQRGDKMEVVGKEQIEGGAGAWKVAITHGDKVTHVFLDETTGLERKISATITNGGTQVLVESLVSDYQPTDGLMVPRKVQTLVGGQAQATVTIEKVEFNLPIDDMRFKMPSASSQAPPQ